MREAAATGPPLAPERHCHTQGKASHSSGSFGFKPGACFVLHRRDGQIRCFSCSLAHVTVTLQTPQNFGQLLHESGWPSLCQKDGGRPLATRKPPLFLFAITKKCYFSMHHQAQAHKSCSLPQQGCARRASSPSPLSTLLFEVPPPKVTCCAPSTSSSHKIAHSGTFP